MAAHKLASEAPGQTLQPTALVHEAWLRVQAVGRQDWQNRTQFFAAAAEAMRRILVDNARRKRTQRHGGGQVRTEFPEEGIAAPTDDDRLLAVHEALDKLAAQDRPKAELVKLRYFVGLSTAKRHWSYAKAWLYREMDSANGESDAPVAPSSL